MHLPFCESKCTYCNFISAKRSCLEQEKYIHALISEIEDFPAQKPASSIFLGGGTPSSIDEKYIEEIMRAIRKKFAVSRSAEISIECNPNSASLEKLKKYRELGFNRVSFGVQSLDDETLKNLGRLHTRGEALAAIKNAQLAGFDNINADLLLGVKNMSEAEMENVIESLDGVTHISAYMLILEEKTKLFNMVKARKIKLLSDDESVNQYELFRKILKKHGFFRYEISNFAKKGYSCKHNENYWECGEYVGFGVSAHSYVDGVRFSNSDDFENYIQNYNAKTRETISKQEHIEELIMLGLRMKKGVSLEKLGELGYDALKNKNALKLAAAGMIKIGTKRMAIRENHFGVTNQIILKLIENV